MSDVDRFRAAATTFDRRASRQEQLVGEGSQVTRVTWQSRAACRDLPTEWWFPNAQGTGTTGEHMYRDARAVCARCPVRVECLDDAREADALFGAHGMRAGLTPGQRAAAWGGRRQGGAYVIPDDPRRRVHPEDVDELTAQGYTRQNIADRLGVSRAAVDKVVERNRVRDDDVSRCACGAWRHYTAGAVCDICARLDSQRQEAS